MLCMPEAKALARLGECEGLSKSCLSLVCLLMGKVLKSHVLAQIMSFPTNLTENLPKEPQV